MRDTFLLLLLLAFPLVACGKELPAATSSDAANPSDGGGDSLANDANVGGDAEGDEGSHDSPDANAPLAWHSYVSHAPSIVTSPALPDVFAFQEDLRLDFSIDAAGMAHAVLSPFLDASFSFSGRTLSNLQLDRPITIAALYEAEARTFLSPATLQLDISPAGVVSGGTIRGTFNHRARGLPTLLGTFSAHLAPRPDVDPPYLNGGPAELFAANSLPWETKSILASEPYEEHLDVASSASIAIANVTALTQGFAWGAPPHDRERGVSFLVPDWSASSVDVAVGKLTDLAGNVAGAQPMHFSSMAITRSPSSTIDFRSNSFIATTFDAGWGSCIDFGECVFSETAFVPCNESNEVVAAWIPGGGDVAVRMRVVATVSTPGVAPPPIGAVYVETANPGLRPIVTPVEITWPSGVGSTFDSDWMTVKIPAIDAAAKETGVAIAVGATNPIPTTTRCAPEDVPYQVTAYFESIAVGAPTA